MNPNPLSNRVRDRLDALDETILLSQPFSEVWGLIIDISLTVPHVQSSSLYWVNHRDDTLDLKATHQSPISTTRHAQSPERAVPSLVTQAAREKQPCLDRLESAGSALAVPVLSNDNRAVVGALYLESHMSQAFTQTDQDFLIALGERAQQVIQRAYLSEAIRLLSKKAIAGNLDDLQGYTVEALAELFRCPNLYALAR